MDNAGITPSFEVRYPMRNSSMAKSARKDLSHPGTLATIALAKQGDAMVTTGRTPPSVAAGMAPQRKRPLSPSIVDCDTLVGGTIERAATCPTLPSVVSPFAQPRSASEQNQPVPSPVQSGTGSVNHLLHSVDMTQTETFGRNCRYIRGRFLKKGASGKVHEATITERGNFTGDNVVAVKIVDVSEDVAAITERWTRLEKRLKNLLDFRHDHLVTYHQLSIVKEPGLLSYENMMDYFSEGDLSAHLTSMRGVNVSSHQLCIMCYAMQLADGLRFLHRQHIIHGDIKPQNVLVKRRQSNHCVLAIGDLDEHVQMQRSMTNSCDISSARGTFWYMSPEMLKKCIHNDSDPMKIGRKTDIWSMGCVLLDMINSRNGDTGRWLVNRSGARRQVGNTTVTPFIFFSLIVNGWVPYLAESIPKFFYDCIRDCLADISDDRISAESLLTKLEKQFGMVSRQLADTVAGIEGCVCLKRIANLQTVHAELDFPIEPGKLGNEYYRQGCDCQYEITDIVDHDHFTRAESLTARIVSSGHFSTNAIVTLNTFSTGCVNMTEIDLRRLIDGILLCDHTQLIFYHKARVFPERRRIEFLTDKLSLGDNLARLLMTRRTLEIPLDYSDVMCYSMQIAAGLNYLHQNHLVHGTLCPKTIFVKYREARHHLLLLDELDCFRPLNDIDTEFFMDYALPYQSPERLQHYFYWNNRAASIGSKADVWSLGCIIVEMLNLAFCSFEDQWIHNRATGKRYSVGRFTGKDLCRKILKGYKPYVQYIVNPSIPMPLLQCIERCFAANEADRISGHLVWQQLCEVVEEMYNAFPITTPRLECECWPRTASSLAFRSAQDYWKLLQPKRQREFVVIFHQYVDEDDDGLDVLQSVYVQLLDPLSGIIRQMPMRSDMIPWIGFCFLKPKLPNREEIVCFSAVKSSKLTNVISYRFLDHSWTGICPEGVTLNWSSINCAAVDDESVYYWDYSEQLEGQSHLKYCSLSSGRTENLPPHELEAENRYWFAALLDYGKNVICCPYGEECVLMFDTEIRRWQSLPDLPEPRLYHKMIILGEHLYLIGGNKKKDTDGYTTKLTTCLRLNLETDIHVWETIKGLNYPRVDPGLFVWNNQIHVYGGTVEYYDTGSYSDDNFVLNNRLDSLAKSMEVYNPENDEWAVVEVANRDSRIIPNDHRQTVCIPVTWVVPDDLDAVLEHQMNLLGDMF